MRFLALLLIAVFGFSFPAQAKHHHKHRRHYVHHVTAVPALHKDCNVLWPCVSPATITASVRAVESGLQYVAHASSTFLPHPAGCPARAFCGCGASVRVFGHSVRDLWLAANWYRFPRAAPAPGMAAVKRHHVFVLEAELGRGWWRVYDANSGHHATRVHARSISGFTIVNPRSG
jgi:hypothetical protein